MKYFIFRNMTIETFFPHLDAKFSGYEDISIIDESTDRYIWFYFAPIAENNVIVEKVHYYTDLVHMIAERIQPGKMLIAFTMKDMLTMQSITSDSSVVDALNKYNASLYKLASKHKNIRVIDFARFLDNYTPDNRIDWRYYFIAQIGFNPHLASEFGDWFTRQMQAIELKRKKCLVLDLDNTLWGGILGEDGIEGVSLGGDYPGKVFLLFQHQILEISKQGVILAVNSKNNLEDVLQMWKEHPDIILKEEHFASVRINWNNKTDNLLEIAQELNIGLDSMVFLDDNPRERELVKKYLPEVIVPDFPEHPYILPVFFRNIIEKYFSIYALTDEDTTKTEQYKSNALRSNMQHSFPNIEDYIRNLQIVLTIAEVNNLTLSRSAQMTQKTNQFNLTTHRYTEMEIKQFIDKNDWVYGLRVKDKFGDYGLTGLIIIKIDGKIAYIDTLLLSCRILGKEIEFAFIKHILSKIKKAGLSKVIAYYEKTAKNRQVENFYDKNGFRAIENSDDHKSYELLLDEITEFTVSDVYKLEDL
ncbi:hypothetical protein FACS189485_18380 [Spirochaetia bacterium]|nr:hypothetical protein FACS189485_18380 [Spirochaetia bacterium]